MRIKRRKPNYEHIAAMEREIANLPVPTLDEQIRDAHEATLAARKESDWTSGRGVLLDKRSTPLEALSGHPIPYQPMVCASAYAASAYSTALRESARAMEQRMFFGSIA